MTVLVRLLLAAVGLSPVAATVWWENSVLLGGYDLWHRHGTYTVYACPRGSYLFASLPANPSRCHKSILIGTQTISQVAALVNATTGEKGYLELPAAEHVDFFNKDGSTLCPLAIFIVCKFMGDKEVAAPTLIDPRVKGRGNGHSSSLTFFSYDPYTIDDLDLQEDSTVHVYHTGVDAVNIYNQSVCHSIHTDLKWKHPQILLPTHSPLLTIHLSSIQQFAYSTKMGIPDTLVVNDELETVVASSGHTGCQGALFQYQNSIEPLSINLHIKSNATMMTSISAELQLLHTSPVLLTTDEGQNITLDSALNTQDAALFTADYHFGKQLNITWKAIFYTDRFSSFAISMKITTGDTRTTNPKIPTGYTVTGTAVPSVLSTGLTTDGGTTPQATTKGTERSFALTVILCVIASAFMTTV